MRTSLLLAAAFALCVLTAAPSTAQQYDATTIDVTGVVAGSPHHTTLTSAVESAGLAETLRGDGPYTVFAPTDAAFAALPAERSARLMAPEGAPLLAGVLNGHVIAERLDAATLAERIQADDGQTTLTSVNGVSIMAAMGDDGSIVLTDAAGHMATVTQADLAASNGVVHVIDAVLMPMPNTHMDMDHGDMDHDMHDDHDEDHDVDDEVVDDDN